MTTDAPAKPDILIPTAYPYRLVRDVVADIMANMPDCSLSMDCVRWKYELMEFSFIDHEDGERFNLDEAKLVAAFPLMFTDKWPKGLQKPPVSTEWDDWETWLCQSDADSFDAFVQLACFGEVIYG